MLSDARTRAWLRPAAERAADNRVYDRGCDLVEAACEIRRLCADPGSARAVPPLLGCLENSLGALADAMGALEDATPAEGSDPVAAERMRHGLENARRALDDAAAAAHAARRLVARVLADREAA